MVSKPILVNSIVEPEGTSRMNRPFSSEVVPILEFPFTTRLTLRKRRPVVSLTVPVTVIFLEGVAWDQPHRGANKVTTRQIHK
jgi:hypothetical protein